MAITLTRAAMQDEFRYPEFIGLSTDGYPSSDDPAVVNGAEVYFMDTQKRYKYDIDNDAWYEVPAEGGGGGGGGGTDNYLLLSNRPKINGVLLNVNNDSANLHLKYTDLETDTKPSINGQKLEGNLSLPQLGITYTNLTEKPRINNVLLQGNMSLDDLGISKSYNALTNKPAVNGVTLDGNKTADDLGLTYPNITDKPSVNGVTLEGNKTSDDLGIIYPNLSQKPKINGVTVDGNISSKTDLGITYNNFDTSDKPAVNNVTLQSGNNTLEALDIRKASESYNKDEIDDLIASARSIRVLETMPASPERNTLYYIGVAPDYDVYLCDTTGLVVNMGTSAVALDQYQKKNDNTLTTAAKTVVGGINEVHNDVLQRVKTADVVNNLSTSSSTKVLSAAMGVQLQDNKVEIAGSGLVKTNVTLNHADNIEPKTDAYVGSETVIPRLKYNSTGHLVSVSTATVYPPTTPGTAGQVWVSRGIGQGEWKDADIGGGGDYNLLNNRPRINGVLMEGNKSTADLGIKYETLPDRPSISGNVISGDKTPAQLGITYPALDTKPSVNGVTLQGNKTTADLKIKYQDTIDKPTINDIEIGQTNTGEDLKLVDLEYTDPDKMGKFILVDDDGFVQYTAPKVNDNDMKWDENTSHDLGITKVMTLAEYNAEPVHSVDCLYIILDGDMQNPDANYNDLANKPSVNGVVLTGNKPLDSLDLYDRGEVDKLIAASRSIRTVTEAQWAEIMADPEKALPNTVYYVPHRDEGGTLVEGVYEVYLFDANKVLTPMGLTEMDLSDYLKIIPYHSDSTGAVIYEIGHNEGKEDGRELESHSVINAINEIDTALQDRVKVEEEDLETDSKKVVEAINELKEDIDNAYPRINNLETTVGSHTTSIDTINGWKFRTFQGTAIKGATGDIAGCRFIGNVGTPKFGFTISNITDCYLIVFARQQNVWVSYKTLWDTNTMRIAGSGTIPAPTYNSTDKKLTFAADNSYYNLAVSAWIIRG